MLTNVYVFSEKIEKGDNYKKKKKKQARQSYGYCAVHTSELCKI